LFFGVFSGVGFCFLAMFNPFPIDKTQAGANVALPDVNLR
jgi:hypothetical protein